MNRVNLIGRLTKNPELRQNTSNIPVVRFTLAINRNYKNQEGNYEADFISCVAWRKTAELINKHFQKGSEMGISGRIQTGKYEKDNGEKVYTTDVIVDEITFIGSKKEDKNSSEYTDSQVETQETEEDPFADFGEQVSLDDNFLD